MTIEITRPEIEELIRQRLHSGAFDSVEDVLFDALEVQKEREAWLQENKFPVMPSELSRSRGGRYASLVPEELKCGSQGGPCDPTTKKGARGTRAP
jgi:hypothetical protein